MLSDEEIRSDLARLKEIAVAHSSDDGPFALGQETIDGQSLRVFKRIPENLSQLYRLGLERAEADFLVYEEQRLSFAETLDLAARLGRVLLEQYHIGPGDRVAICARNSPEWCIAYMGITLIGAIVVPMNSWWQGPELDFGLADSGSLLVFADTPRLRLILGNQQQRKLALIAIRPEAELAETVPEFFALLREATPLTESEIEALRVHADDDASIMYTSGSTGNPKGVLSSHRAIISALYTWKFVREINEILRPELKEENPEFPPAILCNVPLFHVTGSHAQFLASFVNQRKFVMMYKWDPDRALRLIEEERISVFHGVPTMTWELMQAPGFQQTDLRSLRSVQSGGAPRPPEHLTRILQQFPAAAVAGLGYGLTETNAIAAIISGRFYEARPLSTGRPSPPVTDIKIADAEGRSLAANEVGEICIRGPSVMRGYWQQPEATREAIRDGWFHSGDIGKLDELGFLIILDRAKDIVIRGGENIGCAEVEYAIAEHPAVAEASVYGLPDERLGEVPAATIMLQRECELDEPTLRAFLEQRIAAFKIPTRMRFQRQALPRLATGKIAKKTLREQAMADL